MAIESYAVAAWSADEVVDGLAGHFAYDVPKSNLYSTNRSDYRARLPNLL